MLFAVRISKIPFEDPLDLGKTQNSFGHSIEPTTNGLFVHFLRANGQKSTELEWQFGHNSILTDATRKNFLRFVNENSFDLKICNPNILINELYNSKAYDFAGSLEGIFSVCVWDKQMQTLVACVDRTGVVPLFYFKDDTKFIIGNHFPTVVSLLDRRSSLYLPVVKDFLANIITESQYTFFDGVMRLPPGGRIVWSNSDIRVDRYWKLEPSSGFENAQEAVWIPHFKQYFQNAVEGAIHDPLRTGALLSGGLDSSSIAAVAANLRNCRDEKLRVYSIDLNLDVKNSERQYQRSVVERSGLNQTVLLDSDSSYLDGLGEVLYEIGGPVRAPGLLTGREIYKRARDDGIVTLLDGHGGDETVSYGYGLLAELIAEAKLFQLLRTTVPFGIGLTTKAVYRVAQQHSILGSSVARIIRKLSAAGITNSEPSASNSIHDISHEDMSTVPAVDLDEFASAILSQRVVSERDKHFRTLTTTAQSVALQAIYQHGRSEGIEVQFPLWDYRFVSMALSVPSKLKLKDGYDRWILRAAMQGILPDTVRLRRRKSEFNRSLAIALKGRERGRLHDSLQTNRALLEGLINSSKLESCVKQLDTEGDDVDGYVLQAVWRGFAIGEWLRSVYSIPSAPGSLAKQFAIHRIQ
jgi:asparagine synthase (glutamine-hydrolysing)